MSGSTNDLFSCHLVVDFVWQLDGENIITLLLHNGGDMLLHSSLFWLNKKDKEPLLLIWINLNPSMVIWFVEWNYLSIPKLRWRNRWNLRMDK